jgi:acyl-CoA thioesterase I
MASMAARYGLGNLARKALPSFAAALLVLAWAVPPAGAARGLCQVYETHCPQQAASTSIPVRILALGDSLAAGYGLPHGQGFEAQLEAALRAKGHDVRILDGAVSGDTTAGGRARLDWVLAERPDAAIVELGGNDGLRGIDPRDMETNLRAILDTLAARQIPVLLCGMYAPPNLGADYATSFRAVFDGLGKRSGILYDPFFLQGVAADPAMNQPDRIHPNAEGVRRIVARLLPVVERLLAEVQPP